MDCLSRSCRRPRTPFQLQQPQRSRLLGGIFLKRLLQVPDLVPSPALRQAAASVAVCPATELRHELLLPAILLLMLILVPAAPHALHPARLLALLPTPPRITIPRPRNSLLRRARLGPVRRRTEAVHIPAGARPQEGRSALRCAGLWNCVVPSSVL